MNEQRTSDQTRYRPARKILFLFRDQLHYLFNRSVIPGKRMAQGKYREARTMCMRRLEIEMEWRSCIYYSTEITLKDRFAVHAIQLDERANISILCFRARQKLTNYNNNR